MSRTTVSAASSSTRAYCGSRCRRSSTTRSGWCAASLSSASRTVSCGIVGQRGAAADHDRVDDRPQPVRVLARQRRRDPAALPSAAATRPSSVLANFQVTYGRPVLHRMQPGPQRAVGRLVGRDARLDTSTPACAQPGRAAGRDRVRVVDGVDHPGDAGGDDRVDARRGAAGVRARLQGHDERRPARPVAGLARGRPARRADRRPAASPRRRPPRRSASRTTAPTAGFGLVRPRTESASAIACRIAAAARRRCRLGRGAESCAVHRRSRARARSASTARRRVSRAVDRRAGDEHVGAGLGGRARSCRGRCRRRPRRTAAGGRRRTCSRASRTFGSTSAMNCWPPNPGSTVITSSVSNSRSSSR